MSLQTCLFPYHTAHLSTGTVYVSTRQLNIKVELNMGSGANRGKQSAEKVVSYMTSAAGAKTHPDLHGRLTAQSDKKVKKASVAAKSMGSGSVLGAGKAPKQGQNTSNGIVRDGKSVLG